MTNAEKIQTILRHEFTQWQQMSKERLLEMMTEDRRFFLETEADQGNEEYLDELLEEINIPAVWNHALRG
jgi:recombinational DNA repair ATPase RecF